LPSGKKKTQGKKGERTASEKEVNNVGGELRVRTSEFWNEGGRSLVAGDQAAVKKKHGKNGFERGGEQLRIDHPDRVEGRRGK